MPHSDPNNQGIYIPTLDDVNDELSRLCDVIEEHFVHVGASVNDILRSSPWLPNAIKPPPRSPPSPPSTSHAHPAGVVAACTNWVSQHRALAAAAAAFVGTGLLVIFLRRRQTKRRRRRRAHRARNGARTEVVVLAGSLHSPLTRSLALDLERRGFIVYIAINDLEEEHMVHALSRGDIRSLNLDLKSPSSTADTIEEFGGYLSRPDPPHIHPLRLASLIVLPASPLPAAAIAALHPLTWSDTLTTHLVAPFTTIQAFYSLMTAHKPSILFLTPSIIPSLKPPLYGLDNVTAGAMQSYISTFRKEVASQDINVVNFKLGTFNEEDHSPENKALVLLRSNAKTNASRSTRSASAKKSDDIDISLPGEEGGGHLPALPARPALRELHNSVFDAIANGKGRGGTVFVGQGSRTYDWVARWVPGGLIGRILEFRNRNGNRGPQQRSGNVLFAGWDKLGADADGRVDEDGDGDGDVPESESENESGSGSGR